MTELICMIIVYYIICKICGKKGDPNPSDIAKYKISENPVLIFPMMTRKIIFFIYGLSEYWMMIRNVKNNT